MLNKTLLVMLLDRCFSNPEDSDVDDYKDGDVFDPTVDPFVTYVPAAGSGYESAITLLGLDNGLE